MYIINITYKTELEKVDEHLAAHIKFLDEQYALGNFYASGRKVPRTGGVILARSKSKSDIDNIIRKDPFWSYDLADYEVIEFVPSKCVEELRILME